VNLIGSTTTAAGLRVICQTDNTEYELSKKITDEQFEALPIIQIPPFVSWNYMVQKI
jgi:hypothetical protein